MAGPEPSPVAPDLRRRLFHWRTLLSFLIAGGLVALAIWRLRIDPAAVWSFMRRARLPLFALGFLSFYTTFPLRAWRWQLLLRNAGSANDAPSPLPGLAGLTEILYLSWFANCLVPAKLGDLYRGYLLHRSSRASFSRTVGTIFAERVLDMLFLFLLLLAASLALFGPRIPQTASASDRMVARTVYGGGIALAAIAVGVLLGMRFLGPALRRYVPRRFQDLYERFLEGTLLSFRRTTLPLVLAQTLLIWVLESARFYLVFQSVVLSLPVKVSMGVPVVVFVALASSLLTTLPITPAGLGAVEAMFGWILPLFLPAALLTAGMEPQSLAFAVGLLDRVINYWSILVLGFIVFCFSKKR
ncbi:MAG: lysylphosphatidylglycerol synthase transmembrane domain-containing protein [Chloroflexia bacterium]